MDQEIKKFIHLILKTKDPQYFFEGILWNVIYKLTDVVVEADQGKTPNYDVTNELLKVFKKGILKPRELYCSLCEALVSELQKEHTIFDTFKIIAVLDVLNDKDKLSYLNKQRRIVRIIPKYPAVVKRNSKNAKNIKLAKKLYTLYYLFLSSYGDTSIWDMYYYEDFYFFNMAKDFHNFTLA